VKLETRNIKTVRCRIRREWRRTTALGIRMRCRKQRLTAVM